VAVEIILIQKPESFLSPSRIIEMHPNLVQNLAAESLTAIYQREQLSRKLKALVAGIETCRRYIIRSSRSKTSICDDVWELLALSVANFSRASTARRRRHSKQPEFFLVRESNIYIDYTELE
jgi:hypothetical protein